jgi:uncharacterized alkaline shock family protein YloU
MTETAGQTMEQNRSPSAVTGTGQPRSRVARPQASAVLATEKGRTQIADTVVQKIAGIATREIPGVYELGRGAARAFGAVRERVPGAGHPAVGQGVRVEVGEKQTAVDLVIVVEYGVAIVELAGAIRENVISSIERMTGLEVTEVNIAVDDVHLDDDSEPAAEPRVE